MTMFSVRKSLGRVVVAVAFTFAITFSAFAQEFTGKVPTVPATNAPALITSKVDDSKLAPVTIKDEEIAGMKEAKDLGPAAPEMKMGMQLVLRRPRTQEIALAALKQQTMDPQNAMYGKTLTPEDFAKQFGLAGSDLEQIQSWLSGKGFTVGNVDNGRLSVNFEGTVEQVNAAFHTDIHSYTSASGESRYAYATTPKIPVALAGVVGRVSGLQNFSVYNQRGFDGPVTDFAEGTVGEPTSTSGAPKKAPEMVRAGDAPRDASFTASAYSMPFGGSTQLNIRIGGGDSAPTGSLNITDQNGKSVGFISDISTCEPYNNGMGRSCNVSFTPTAAGTFFLKASYSGGKEMRGVEQLVHINATGSQTTTANLVISPIQYINNTAGTFTAVLTWSSGTNTPSPMPYTQPTGTITILNNFGGVWGTATLPAVGSTSSSGSTVSGTYTCTGSLADQYLSCVVTNSSIDTTGLVGGFSLYGAGNTITSNYSGDTNYAASLGSGYLYVNQYVFGTPENPTISSSTALTAATYGATQTETVTIAVVGVAGQGNPGIATGYPFVDVTGAAGNALGTMADYTTFPTCSRSGTTYTCTFTGETFTVPAVVTPGIYTVKYNYSGSGYCNTSGCEYNSVSSAGTSLTVNKQTPTFGTMTFTPSSVVQGQSQAVVISDTLNYTGVGAAPTGAVTYVLNAVNYTATCTSGSVPVSSPLTCTATVPGATVAALANGNYTVTAAYTTDVNYGAATGTSGTFVVGNIGSGLTATPSSQVYGSGSSANTGTAVSLVDTISITTGNPAPTGTVTFTNSGGVTAIGSVAITACPTSTSGSLTLYTCTYNWAVPAGASGDNAGTYTVTATLPANGSYATQTATAGVVISKDGTTTTLSANPNAITTGSRSTVFTSVTTWNAPGNGLNPTGTVAITCGVGSAGSCANLPAAMTVTSCTTSVAARTITCTFPSYNVYTNTGFYGVYNFTATYSGDVNYSSSAGVAPVTVNQGVATTTTPSVTSGSPVTYGSGTSVVFSVVVTGVNGDGAPTGTLVLSNPTLGTMATVSTNTCTATNSYTYTCSVSYAVPAATAVGSYTVTATYGGGGPAFIYTGSSGTTSFTVAKAATTAAMTSPTSTSPVTQTVGSLTAFTVTGTLSWAGSGTKPTSSDISFTSTAAGAMGAASCSGASSPYTCTATFTPTGTDVVGNYNINITFSGDGNYTTSTSTQVGNYVIAPPPDIQFSSVTHNMGSVAIGNSTTYGVHVTNTTAAAIPFTAITISTSASPNPFSSANNCGTSVPVAGCEIVFTFAPVAGNSGTLTATWSMTGTAGGTTFGPSNGGTLTGTVSPSGNVTISTAGHNFGNVTVGTTSPTYGTVITNSTNAAVTLTLGSVTSPFASMTNCPTTLGAGVSCNLNFTFHPTATGLVQQQYSISVNGGAIPLLVGGNPTTGVTLTGTGD